ncbi:TPA: hypothetical protein ACPZUT_000236 [Yersinia enterocolitica]
MTDILPDTLDQKYSMKLLNEELTDAQRINHVLQAAIDHYPRLVAFQLNLQGANTDALSLPEETARDIRNHPAGAYTEGPTRALAFQADVEHRFGDHALARMTAGKPSPPTLLRWMWETGNALTYCISKHLIYKNQEYN